MNRVLPAWCFLFLLYACNSPSTKETNKDTVQVKSAATADPAQAKLDALKKMSPMGLDELGAMLPESVNGWKQNNLSLNSNMGYAVAHADYIKNSKTDIRVNITDCAGEAGANVYTSSFASRLNKSEQNEEGYTRTMGLNGTDIIESFENKTNARTLTSVVKDRILLVVTGRNVDSATVYEALKQISARAK